VEQLNARLQQGTLRNARAIASYLATLQADVHTSQLKLRAKSSTSEGMLTYHTAYMALQHVLPTRNIVLVSEGANTMDIARSYFNVHEPRSRLDAGTFATMGVTMGYTIAAKMHDPSKLVVAVVGDSAFGFRHATV
jgi:2-hydroxyacyl-CoA lyase 1